MAAPPGYSSSVATLPPPRPRSPPEYPDLYGKRRETAKVQMLEREIGFLEEELKSMQALQPASICCKEVTDFVVANSDPIIPANRKKRRAWCGFRKWFCGSCCCNFSWICCCTKCTCDLRLPRCSDCCNCLHNPCKCTPCTCSCPTCNFPSCFSCSAPNCTPCCCPRPNCVNKKSCKCKCKCCGWRLPSCPTCSCRCSGWRWKCCGWPKWANIGNWCSCKNKCCCCVCF